MASVSFKKEKSKNLYSKQKIKAQVINAPKADKGSIKQSTYKNTFL